MHFNRTKLSGLWVIEPKPHGDRRGWFLETYREDLFAKQGIRVRFVQDNHSRSERGVLRGLHYQAEPRAQAKLVRVIVGAAFDVVVDIRPGSRTFGQWLGFELSAENKRMLFVPKGFAHGFLALEDGTEFVYKCSDIYSPKHERGILWCDAEIGIDWPRLAGDYKLSDKDKTHPTLREAFAVRRKK